jgi:hypothetical protein
LRGISELHVYNCNIPSFLTSVSDPYSAGSVDTKPSRQKRPTKEKNKELYVLKFWIFFGGLEVSFMA